MSTNYCRFIRSNGTRCHSRALAGKHACYWHHDLARRHRRLHPTNADLPATIPDGHRDIAVLQREPGMAQYYGVDLHGPLAFDFPPLEDREAIQVSLSMLLDALGQNRLEPKRAASMLYLLQVASINAHKLGTQPRHVVHDTVLDDTGTELAPDEDPGDVLEAQQLLQDIEDELAREEDEEDEGEGA